MAPTPKHLFFLRILLLVFVLFVTEAASEQKEAVRFGLTPVFLDDQESVLEPWRDYLSRRLGRPVQFVQRASYREITEMLVRGELDFAWTCGLPYVKHREYMKLVAVPLYRGSPLYQSYLIVSAQGPRVESWSDLRDVAFAYSDPDSNSGYLYPMVAMQRAGLDSEHLFRKRFFAWGHRNVVEAVAVGLAEAGAVDGYIWETLAVVRPQLTAATRVAAKSPWFGFPPVVAGRDTDPEAVEQLRRILEGMADDGEGAGLLKLLALDGFVAGEPRLYDDIAAMVGELRGAGWRGP